MDNRLQELRKDIGISQKDFFNQVIKKELEMNISFRTYQNWENPSNSIKEESALKLAKYFEVSLGYLLGFGTIEEEIDRDIKIKKSQFSRENNILLELGYLLSDRQLNNILDTIHIFHASNKAYFSNLIEYHDEFIEDELEVEFFSFIEKYPDFLAVEKEKYNNYKKIINDPKSRAETEKKLELIKKYQEEKIKND
ncbi:helix-turn-helix domain-containing protein [Streptococcus hongkongensis]